MESALNLTNQGVWDWNRSRVSPHCRWVSAVCSGIGTRDRVGSGLAAGRDGAAFRLQPGGAGAAVRSQRELGVAAAGVSGASAGGGSAAGARGQDRGASGNEVSRAGGAEEPGGLPGAIPHSSVSTAKSFSPTRCVTWAAPRRGCMAATFAEHHCDTRQAAQLYAAWRRGLAAIRQCILEDPSLFFKTQRQEKAPPGAGADLIRDLKMVSSIVSRAQRRLDVR